MEGERKLEGERELECVSSDFTMRKKRNDIKFVGFGWLVVQCVTKPCSWVWLASITVCHKTM